MSYRINNNGEWFEYRMMISTSHLANAGRLATSLQQLPAIREFRLSPTGD